jgi:hypothetical protein
MKKFIVFALLALLVIGGFSFWAYKFVVSELPKKSSLDTMPLPPNERSRVEAYLRENINAIAPEPAVLGGKFFITNMTFLSTSQVLVSYEDGHNAFIGRVDFFLEPGGIIKVLEFVIVKRN